MQGYYAQIHSRESCFDPQVYKKLKIVIYPIQDETAHMLKAYEG